MNRFLLIYWRIAIFAFDNEAPGRACDGRMKGPGDIDRMFNL